MKSHYYRRKLPHFQPAEATFFITFRLYGSIPVKVIRQLQEQYNARQKDLRAFKNLHEEEINKLSHQNQKRLLVDTDRFLDTNPNGPYWLRQKEVAEVVVEALHFRAGKQYHLHAYTIMPNHVHLLITLLPEAPVLFRVMQHLKRNTAKSINALSNRVGSRFWEEESYDHIVRNEESFRRIAHYILQNPVKARLVSDWKSWPYSYVNPDMT